MSQTITEEQIKQEWTLADKDKSGTLTKKEIKRLIGKLNMKLKSSDIRKKFKEVDVDNSKTLDFNEFIVFLERLRIRPEIEEILNKASNKKGHLTAEEFLKFLQTTQKNTTATLANAKELIAEFEKKDHEGNDATIMYSTGFANYLSSPVKNHSFNPLHATVYQDMNQPFAHYFIASSHNTYLLGDQLAGESSVEAYINAFKKGCKCVELDCWDGSDKSMPIIYHGHTLTSKITFKEVLEAIRDHGFSVSPYPVILSLEVHCGIEGQQAMAKLVREILGTAGMIPAQPDVTGELPAPEKLKNQVLLKGKMINFRDDEDEDEDDKKEQEKVIEQLKKKGVEGKKEESEEEDEISKEKKRPSGGKIAAELSELIHLKAVHFKNFEDSKANAKAWEMSSFSENKVGKFITKSPAPFVDYNSRQLSRIYPKGIRFDSSNYDPMPSWLCGAQIVALNYQTGSEPMWINDAKFLDNGKSGYVLKPLYMRDKPTYTANTKQPIKKTLFVEVVSGFQLPKTHGKEEKKKGEVIDPYVKLWISGTPTDKRSCKTKTIKNNGFNPVWKTEFKFPLAAPELAILTFTVADSDFVSADDFIGQYTIAVANIREGYRYLPLCDKKGNEYDRASLLLHFRWA